MVYLLDANVLIDSNRDYYPLQRVPEFWDWLVHLGQQGHVKIPLEVYEEVKTGTDELAEWLKNPAVEAALLFREEVDVSNVIIVTERGYAPDLSDIEVEKIGRDPFLIAYGLVSPAERCIVTTEVSKPSAQRANRKVPDVCKFFGVAHCNTFAFVRLMNFSTNWKSLL